MAVNHLLLAERTASGVLAR